MANLRQSPTEIEDKSKFSKSPQKRPPKSDVEYRDDDDDDGYDDLYHLEQCYQCVPKTKSISSIPPHNYHNSSMLPPNLNPLPMVYVLCILLRDICGILRSTGRHHHHRRWLTITTSCVILLFHISTLPTALAAPQSCILCDKNDLKAKDPQGSYEEFLFEHQVTRQDAINALKQLNESFYDGLQSDSSCNAVRCTEKVSKYCLGPQFINDHCWCEFGHSTEGLPFVPHMCYVGEKVYKPSVGSCFLYEEVKECCCSALLAREWRHISSSTSLHRNDKMYYNYSALVIVFMYLLIRKLHF
ncbi:uncharacterized protein LOC142234021 [Haematobia irritans]|uniref:uncharacterized protein LOC142234021 n=1 Tax=Haematobia irritans TaxID=7368 RepID=UPI003F500F18